MKCKYAGTQQLKLASLPILTVCMTHVLKITNSGCGKKRGARNSWSMVIPEKAAPVPGPDLTRGILALSRQTLGDERHRYAITRPKNSGLTR